MFRNKEYKYKEPLLLKEFSHHYFEVGDKFLNAPIMRYENRMESFDIIYYGELTFKERAYSFEEGLQSEFPFLQDEELKAKKTLLQEYLGHMLAKNFTVKAYASSPLASIDQMTSEHFGLSLGLGRIEVQHPFFRDCCDFTGSENTRNFEIYPASMTFSCNLSPIGVEGEIEGIHFYGEIGLVLNGTYEHLLGKPFRGDYLGDRLKIVEPLYLENFYDSTRPSFQPGLKIYGEGRDNGREPILSLDS